MAEILSIYLFIIIYAIMLATRKFGFEKEASSLSQTLDERSQKTCLTAVAEVAA
jgi:hypothetical protein